MDYGDFIVGEQCSIDVGTDFYSFLVYLNLSTWTAAAVFDYLKFYNMSILGLLEYACFVCWDIRLVLLLLVLVLLVLVLLVLPTFKVLCFFIFMVYRLPDDAEPWSRSSLSAFCISSSWSTV